MTQMSETKCPALRFHERQMKRFIDMQFFKKKKSLCSKCSDAILKRNIARISADS